MNWYAIVQYINFLRASTNQHDVHSPFIYNFITKGLYTKPHYKTTKFNALVIKAYAYFKPQNVFLQETHNLSFIQQHINQSIISTTPQNADFLVFNGTLNLKKVLAFLNNNTIAPESIIILKNPNANKETIKIWQTIKQHNKVKQTIDFYHSAILFFRTTQAKEHFTIRF